MSPVDHKNLVSEMDRDGSPAVQWAVEFLSAEIRSGRYEMGDFLPSETALAEALRVSRGTIRRAIDRLIKQELLHRKAHSRPVIASNASPREKRNGTDIQTWISHPISDESSLRFMRGISKGLSGTPYRLIVREPTRFFGNYVKSDEREFLMNILQDENTAGIIVERDPYAQNDDLFRLLHARGIPVIFVDVPPPTGLSADYVGTSNASSARRVVEHLIHLGHTRIACVCDCDVAGSTLERIRGYRRAMEQAGLAGCQQVLIADQLPLTNRSLSFTGNFKAALSKAPHYQAWTQRTISALVESPELPTALFVTCDVFAYWIGAALEGHGISIPNQVSLTGFDWIAGYDPRIEDHLTTCAQDFESMGQHASDLLLDRISLPQEQPDLPRHVLIDAPLVIRASTSPPSFSNSSPMM